MPTEVGALPRDPETLTRKAHTLSRFLQAFELSLDDDAALQPPRHDPPDLADHAAALRTLVPDPDDPLAAWKAILRGLMLVEAALAPRVTGRTLADPDANDLAALLAGVASERQTWDAGIADEERARAAQFAPAG
ncbi:MAG TPA: hypothetical protein VIC85_15610 [Ktedonobacterales bacterium]|jgi:hypothetical protein